MQHDKDYAIGVFDSGLGGLTVVKELMRQLPLEDIVYFGDTARVPYGTKSKESIIRFSKENVSVLLHHQVKMIVVACNSSTSHALSTLKEMFNIPIVGVIEPGVRRAVKVTRNRNVGVIATPATVNSNAYARLLRENDKAIRVVSKACPLFVPLVEEGWFQHRITQEICEEYLSELKKSGIDTLILGCTHYPLLKSVLKKVMGPEVKLVDSGQEVAVDVKHLLRHLGLERTHKRRPKYQFLASDDPHHFARLARRFLGYDIKGVRRVM